MEPTTSSAPTAIKQVPLDRQMCIARYSPCGKILAAAGADPHLLRWDTSKEITADEKQTLSELPKLESPGAWVTTLDFAQSKDHNLLIAADSWGNVTAWNYLAKETKPVWQNKNAHAAWVRAVAVSVDGKEVATAGDDRQIHFWQTSDGKHLRTLTAAEDVYSLQFHPSEPFLLAGDLKGNITVWDLTTSKPACTLDASPLYLYHRIQDVGGVRVVRFSPDGSTVLAAGIEADGGGFVQGKPVILVFDWNKSELRQKLTLGESKSGFVHDMQLHPEGYWLGVTSGQPGNGSLFLLEPGAEKPFFEHTKLPNCHSVTLHPAAEQFCFVSTNSGSNGNGKRLVDGEYKGNYTLLNFWSLTAESAS